MEHFQGCKHQIFDIKRLDARFKIQTDDVWVWIHRPKEIALDGITEVNFCEKVGRIHSKENCENGHYHCNNPEMFYPKVFDYRELKK